MPKKAKRGSKCSTLPHAQYGVDLDKVPDTYVEPFTAYRVWNLDADGITSLNHAHWTPKVAFEAVCELNYHLDQHHLVPDPNCSCGMYAGINMQHLIDIGYIQHGIHGEVSLWGRLMRHSLGWRAQFAYPKFFVVPANMIPLKMDDAQERLGKLVEFDVDIYLQPSVSAKVGGEKIPLWMKDYGYSQQGLSVLIEKRQKWYEEHPKTHRLAVGDRVMVFGGFDGSGIGIVREISGDDVFYWMFNPNVVYRKPLKSIQWNDKNWQWETTGSGAMRKLELAMGKR